MSTQASRAKTKFLDWFDKSDQPSVKRGKFASGIDTMFRELPKRDTWSECLTVLLGDCTASKFHAEGETWRAVPCQQGLAVSTVVPGWGFGWEPTFKDEFVYHELSWFLHYSRQYIHRSNVARVLMIGWECEGVVLHPFGSQINSSRYGAKNPPKTADEALNLAVIASSSSYGKVDGASTTSSAWCRRNTLEPAIHQAIFHFLRAQKLVAADFELEAIVAFDCVLQSIQAMNWYAPIGNPRHDREDLTKTLHLDPPYAEEAGHLYALRNEFAAHPGGWRWWDTSELIGDETLQRFSDLTQKCLEQAADLEPLARRIEPSSDIWSNWLLDHFSIVFDAVKSRP